MAVTRGNDGKSKLAEVFVATSFTVSTLVEAWRFLLNSVMPGTYVQEIEKSNFTFNLLVYFPHFEY